MGSENFGRFFGSLGTMAPWYYVKPLLLNSVPTQPDRAVRGLRGATDLCRPRTLFRQPRGRVAVRLFAIFWIVTVVFFSVAAYKRRAYLLAAVAGLGRHDRVVD